MVRVPLERTSDCPENETLAALVGGQLRLDQHPDVEAHLAGCSACQNLLAVAVDALGDTSGPVAEELSDGLQLGEVLASKYRIEGVLGSGAMGTVYAARHGELGQLVAIKVLQSAAPTAAARFLREAKITAHLRSEHTARVFDFGRTGEDAPFIVMEHLAGEDLANLSKRGPVSAARAAAYAVQVCKALSEAHAAGVVHRDLKPSNLFLTRRSDGSECIKVLDFGISKRLSEGTSDESHELTHTQSLLGSPAYMSPEQLRESKDVDARTDIWSLGVVLYELVTCRRPFNATSLAALSASIAADEPPSLSSLRTDVPVAFERVVMRCLRKDPRERFPSAAELAAALAPIGQPRPGRLRSWGCLAVVVLALGTGLVLFNAGERDSAEAIGEPPELQASVPPPQPVLPAIQCDLHPSAAASRVSVSRVGASSPLERSWPLSAFCESRGTAAVELLDSFGSKPLALHAQLAPPLPFHEISIEWTDTERAVRIRRTLMENVTFKVEGADCARVDALLVSSPALPAPIRATRTISDAPCRFVARLPFETFNTTLALSLMPSHYTARDVPFDRSALTLAVERKALKKNAVVESPVVVPAQPVEPPRRPEPCVPPKYCQD
jgi:serine/threonine protein kinase